MNLLQNCDLPRPIKVFVGLDNRAVISSMYKSSSSSSSSSNMGFCHTEIYENPEKHLEVLKALRLSQTRAREAENKAEVLAKERDFLSGALLREATHLFAHRQLVRLLELQVLSLRSKISDIDDHDHNHDHGHGDGVCVPWILALAFCFGIAFGCRYLF